MSALANLARQARFAWGIRGHLRRRLSLPEARDIIQRRLAEREGNFISTAERAIFRHPNSPYVPLFKQAGCTLGDLRDMVRTRGLEATLGALYDAGIYVTYEEFKGRTPIVRGGQTLHVRAEDFDNPLLRHYHTAPSGGTTGPRIGLSYDLAHLTTSAQQLMLAYAAHGLLGIPAAIWRGTLSRGIYTILREVPIGSIPKKWFTFVPPRDLPPSRRIRLLIHYVVALGRFSGLRIPRPELVPLDRADVVVEWALQTLARHGRCLIRCLVSQAVRTCLAARRRGASLSGVAFMGGGEPPTPAKVQEITRTGARWIPTYAISEAGQVGHGCARPADGTDVHFLSDALALIQRPRDVPGWPIRVEAFYLSSLLSSAPKVMLNVETDDYGVIERRSCGCPLEACGFSEHLRDIFSFRKLTSEGMTLVGSDMVHVLEHVLPARFGGSPLDYQLHEEEEAEGFTRLNLLISPRVRIADEMAVVDTVIRELGPLLDPALRLAGTLRVKRVEPIWTGEGKLMPLNLARRIRRDWDRPLQR